MKPDSLFLLFSNRLICRLAVASFASVVFLISVDADGQGLPVTTDSRPTTRRTPETKDGKKQTRESKKQPPLTSQRVAEIRNFVSQHHADVLPLLDLLQKKSPRRYQRAIKGLDREVRSLEKLQQRSPERHAVVLKQWINRSQIRLLTAQARTTTETKELASIRQQIESLMKDNQNDRLQLLNRDLKDAQAQVQRIEKKIKTLQQNGPTLIQKKMQSLNKNKENKNTKGSKRTSAK